jgi:hypothetical protein
VSAWDVVIQDATKYVQRAQVIGLVARAASGRISINTFQSAKGSFSDSKKYSSELTKIGLNRVHISLGPPGVHG